MSLDKAIKHGKEHRKKYYDSRAFDMYCRRGTCPYCLRKKLYNSTKRKAKAKDMEDELRQGN